MQMIKIQDLREILCNPRYFCAQIKQCKGIYIERASTAILIKSRHDESEILGIKLNDFVAAWFLVILKQPPIVIVLGVLVVVIVVVWARILINHLRLTRRDTIRFPFK